MAGKPVGLLSELTVLINDNNDNAVHDVYMERVNELFRSRQQQQYSRTFRSEDLHQLITVV